MATILTVDDALVMRKLVATILETAGHSVITLASGESALRFAKMNAVDLVITDQYMEGIKGTTLVRRLRELESYATTPILILTTESAGSVKQTARDVGANGWVQKPINPEDFIAGITKVLKKHGVAA